MRIRSHSLMRNALFEVWWSKHLRPSLFAASVADPSVCALLGPGDPDTVLARLEEPDAWFAAPARMARDKLLLETLAEAYDECAERMGLDPSVWAWGQLHQGFFEHALTAWKEDEALDISPLPIGGSDSTPMNATYRFSDFRVVLGASFRIVVDVGAWDNSVCINAPGQSGNPRSPHYGDLADRWSKGEYVPLLYTREAVDVATRRSIILRPVSSASPRD